MRSNLDELRGAWRAINAGEIALAKRYLGNAMERVQCMYCHGDLNDGRPYEPHFKGYVHDECKATYHGRLDYLRQHPEDDDGS